MEPSIPARDFSTCRLGLLILKYVLTLHCLLAGDMDITLMHVTRSQTRRSFIILGPQVLPLRCPRLPYNQFYPRTRCASTELFRGIVSENNQLEAIPSVTSAMTM
jgi:hypothetical protein